MIVLLLSCSSSWLRAKSDCSIASSLRGVRTSEASAYANDSVAIIPIEIIREANVKLIEREYLIETLNTKDSIISSYARYKIKTDSTLRDYHNKLSEQVRVNEELKHKIKYNKQTSLYKYIGVGVISSLLTIILLK